MAQITCSPTRGESCSETPASSYGTLFRRRSWRWQLRHRYGQACGTCRSQGFPKLPRHFNDRKSNGLGLRTHPHERVRSAPLENFAATASLRKGAYLAVCMGGAVKVGINPSRPSCTVSKYVGLMEYDMLPISAWTYVGRTGKNPGAVCARLSIDTYEPPICRLRTPWFRALCRTQTQTLHMKPSNPLRRKNAKASTASPPTLQLAPLPGGSPVPGPVPRRDTRNYAGAAWVMAGTLGQGCILL